MENLEESIKRIDKVTEAEKTLIHLYKAWYNSKESEMWSYLDKL